MKAKIKNIEFEGTPKEFAELLRLQTAKVECSEKTEDNTEVLRQTVASCSDKGHRKNAALISVLHNDEPVGTMGLKEFASLIGREREIVRKWFYQEDKIEYKGYTATMIYRGEPRRGIKVKATDSKGNNRIYLSNLDFCYKTKTSPDALAWLRRKQPKGPWQINGFTVEKIS